MRVDFSTLSHQVHLCLKGILPTLSLGQSHQLLAAAYGYKSLAAYKASTEEQHYFTVDGTGSTYFVLDLDLVKFRQVEMGYSDSMPIARAMYETMRNRLKPEFLVCETLNDLFDEIRSDVEYEINDSAEFSNAQADTNTSGAGDFNIEFTQEAPLEEKREDWAIRVEGTAHLDQDIERPYSGDVINVSAQVVFQKLGRRLLSNREVREIGAGVHFAMEDGDYNTDDEEQDKPEDLGLSEIVMIDEVDFDRLIDEAETMAEEEAKNEEKRLLAKVRLLPPKP